MRVLFAVDSFFQLIEATNLRLSIYKEAEADIAIYASTPRAEEIYKNLERKNVFNNCYFIETPLTRCGDKYSFAEKLPKYFIYLYTLMNPIGYVKNSLRMKDLNYDQFLFAGNGALPECIFNAAKKTNSNMKCIRFEDSYVSYTKVYGKKKSKGRIAFESFFRGIFGGHDIEKSIKGYYFASPDLVQVEFDYPIIEAPKISRENVDLIDVLNDVFAYYNLKDLYEEKYIFFESGDAYFEKNDEDVEFIKILAQVVGEQQILIKRHPRCVENRFAGLGVHIAETSAIPWELIQLNRSLDDKVFISTTSAAALSSEIYFGDQCKAILLFEAMEHPPASVSDVMRKYLIDFQNKYGKGKLYIPKDKYELEKIVKEI